MGSAVYQLTHVPTGYPAQHDGIVIDELNLSAWLPEIQLTVGKLHAANAAVGNSRPGWARWCSRPR